MDMFPVVIQGGAGLCLELLPDEILLKVLSYCDIFHIYYRISRVSAKFHQLCQDSSLWCLIRFDGTYHFGVRHYYNCNSNGIRISDVPNGRSMVRLDAWEDSILRSQETSQLTCVLPPTWVTPYYDGPHYSCASSYHVGQRSPTDNEEDIITAAGKRLRTLVLTDKNVYNGNLIKAALRKCPNLQTIYLLGCQELTIDVVNEMSECSLRHLFLDRTSVSFEGWHCLSAFRNLRSICVTDYFPGYVLEDIADNCDQLEVFTLPRDFGGSNLVADSLQYFFQRTERTLRKLHIYFPITRQMFLHLKHCTRLETLKVHNARHLGNMGTNDMIQVFEKLSGLKVLSLGNEVPLSGGGVVISSALLKVRLPNLICLELAGMNGINVSCVNILPVACPALVALRLNNCKKMWAIGEEDLWVECFEEIVNGCANLTSLEAWGNKCLVRDISALEKLMIENSRIKVFRICWMDAKQLMLMSQGKLQMLTLPDLINSRDVVKLTSEIYKKAISPGMYREAWGLELY